MANDEPALFELPPAEKVSGLLEFERMENETWKKLLVHFRSRADHEAFCNLIGQRFTLGVTKNIWFPPPRIEDLTKIKPPEVKDIPLRYPIYILSRGKFVTRPTAKALDRLRIPYKIVVEQREYERYAETVVSDLLLKLPFDDLGQGWATGRNWIKQHSTELGHERHWILDDDIVDFSYYDNGLKLMATDASVFADIEDFCDRWENVAVAGMNLYTEGYFIHVSKPTRKRHSYTVNVPLMSCMLVSNLAPYLWHGTGVDDLIVSALKDRWCSVLFNACFALKQITSTTKVKFVGIDYKIFRKNGLVKKVDIDVPAESDFDEESIQSYDEMEKEVAEYETSHQEQSDVDQATSDGVEPDVVQHQEIQEDSRIEDSEDAPPEISAEPNSIPAGAEPRHVDDSDGAAIASENISEENSEENLGKKPDENPAEKYLQQISAQKKSQSHIESRKAKKDTSTQLDLFGML